MKRYVPNHFKKSERQVLHQHIRDYSFGVLVIADEQGIEANHVPFHLCCDEEVHLGFLQCHVARKNPVWQRLQSGARVLVVFQGPNAYISPSWYPTKAETGKVVPTWNYLAVHAQGVARIVEDPEWLHQQIRALTDQHEATMTERWPVDDAPADFVNGLTRAIVGIEIKIEKLTG